MATYVPNATDATEPTASKTVLSAAEEFRTLKASINSMRQWLGVHAVEPTVDTLGNALSNGDFYYNSALLNIFVYNSGTWRVGQKTATQFVAAGTSLNIVTNSADILVITPTNNFTFTESMNDGQSALVLIVNPGTYTVTWPAGIKWLNGVTPTLLSTGVTFVELTQINGVLYGVALGGAV
jgi:hypothetical protein